MMKCPVGTYGYIDAATAPEDCNKCPANLYCDDKGKLLSAFSINICADGYKCPEGTKSKIPSQFGSDQVWCDPGFMCTQGLQSKCPSGTF